MRTPQQILQQILYPPCLGLKTPGHLFHLDPAAQPRVTAKLEAGLGRSLTQYESDVLTHARSVGGVTPIHKILPFP